VPGDLYDQAKIDDLKRAIIATGLASTVDVKPVPSAEPGRVDIAVAMEPAPPRTIAGELGYGTGEGARAEVSWTHRNLIRPEGSVTFRGVAGTREQYLGAVLRQSNFGVRDRVLNARIAASNIDRAAFEARTFEIGAGIERQTNIIWQKKWTWSLGAELIASDERDITAAALARRTFFIGALPASLGYDGSDDLLDPRRGFRLGIRGGPEVSLDAGTFPYFRAQLDGSAYFPVGKTLTIAGRGRVATIVGAGNFRIAPSRRLYSGGGGSIRGYGFQMVGPRDINNDPIGGRSLVEFGLEARVRFGDFGVVPFLDGGNVYAGSTPKLSGLRYGAGIGGRYYSTFGPIRIDVATPLNPRRGDSRVTVFVSLGQAF
jgi:translocation and assembly module TamA